MFNLQAIQNALQTQTAMHGWVFTNFSHRDSLTDSLLSLNADTISSRRWVYIIPTSGNPVKIVHAIERSILEDLPGDTIVYSGRKELISILKQYSSSTFACLVDKDISVISTVDAGFIQSLQECDINVVSASQLIQITKGLLTPKGIESHERAATLLYKIVLETWEFISFKFKANLEVSEYDVLQFILNKFATYSLVYHHEPIVAFGKNAGDPHYSVPISNSAIAKKGDIIQLDIFAKEKAALDENGNISKEGAIYADISWVGVYDTTVPQDYKETFETLCSARDIVYTILHDKACENRLFDVTGFELDAAVRDILISAGFQNDIKHRTGHGIDTACHGSGVNLDSVEFPDKRTMLNGSCFSVEPGLYFDSYGMRTEIDIYIENGMPRISGSKFTKLTEIEIPQKNILYIK